jgi:hypothetical protein
MLEITLAKHCAPVLFGKKPAAIFSKPEWWDSLFPRNRLCFITLTRPAKSCLVFLYDPCLLSGALQRHAVRRELRRLAYPVSEGLAACLGHLSRRFESEADFPHEIGFFLGYPAEDVIGFIRHRGAHCKLCGMWKVYSDVERAEALFAEYEKCKQALLEYISGGNSIFEGTQKSARPSMAQTAPGLPRLRLALN